jgi:uncharacterized protein YodC (DUF2158 family)
MAQQFQPGGIVRVKSGGPNMTVAFRGGDDELHVGQVFCEWFHKEEQKNGWFHEGVLEKV